MAEVMSAQRKSDFEPMVETGTAVVHDEQRLAWELLRAWLARQQVRLTLTERCCLATIVGRVTSVSVTGAAAFVDGWQWPVVDIRGIGKPTRADVDAYAHAMQHLRDDACDFCRGEPVGDAASWLDGKPRPP